MDPLHLCIAMGPLGVYLLLIGWLNLSQSPFVTTGTRDVLALAIAISGFVIAGPMELFMPETAAVFFRAWIWPPLICLYLLCATFAAMLTRPRLVIYNVTAEQLHPVLEGVAAKLDDNRCWVGQTLMLPNRGVHLNIESFPAMRNIQLTSVGGQQDLGGWRLVEQELRLRLKGMKVGINPRGFSFLFFGLLIAILIGYSVATKPLEVAEALNDFLRL
ncbi:MAG: hypothetical protein P8N76_02430 [Pirellulaceae bacterium]|nr:hypothetical protein [Pirellulaceae bacterium]